MTIVGLFNVGHPEPWMRKASCTSADPEAFFLTPGEDPGRAKNICRGCDVRQECLAFALEHNEGFGIWGGLSPRERMSLRRGDRPPHRPGYCRQGHELAIVGIASHRGCAKCHEDRQGRYYERQRNGHVPPRKRDRERRGGAA